MGNLNGKVLLDNGDSRGEDKRADISGLDSGASNVLMGDEESGWFFQVLEYSDNATRSNTLFLCRRFTKLLTTEASFRWRLERLHIEDGIYSLVYASATSSSKSSSFYRDKFLHYRTRRMLWWHDEDDNSASPSTDHDAANDNSFNIDVSVRFKPTDHIDNSRRRLSDNNAGKTVTLPLHQRLALIRIENGLDSNSEALNILMEEGGWFKDRHWSSTSNTSNSNEEHQGDHYHSSSSQDQDNKNHKSSSSMAAELPHSLSCGINSIDCQSNSVVVVDPTKGLRNFYFDHVLPDTCTQSDVYDTSVRSLICDFINGMNASCLVYGVTGSGKTFTMFGPDYDECRSNSVTNTNSNTIGIVPKACQEIFDAIEYRRKHLNLTIESTVAVSYIEVYGNQICDLLQQGSQCCPNKAASQRFVLSGAAEMPVSTVEDVMKLLLVGETQKRRAATAMNDRSSRAHTIFIITLNQNCVSTGIHRSSCLFLVDLGGCEQTKKSDIASGSSKHFERLKHETMMKYSDGKRTSEIIEFGTMSDTEEGRVENNQARNAIITSSTTRDTIVQNKPVMPTNAITPTSLVTSTSATSTANKHGMTEYSIGFVQSERMREAVNINLGLMALKACVNALISERKSKYIPYADSKLTMMLSTVLGGNSKTSVIVCASQDRNQVPETVAALKFGQTCRKVTNTVKSETDFLRKLIQSLDAQISKCEDRIKMKERWEVQEETRQDVLAEDETMESKGFGGMETRKTTILVGAEEEHKLLSDLLRQKAELTGHSMDTGENGGKRFGGAVGFGVAYKYGLGDKHNINGTTRRTTVIGSHNCKATFSDSSTYRFGDVDEREIPETVKMAGGKDGWHNNAHDDRTSENESTKMKTMKKKQTLAYSGLSA